MELSRNSTEANRLLVAVMNKLSFNGLQATSDERGQKTAAASVCVPPTLPLHFIIQSDAACASKWSSNGFVVRSNDKKVQ
jgi:hypothetical protein